MTILKNAIAIALVATTFAASGTIVQAAPFSMTKYDLPILVDLNYELKNPSGPVEAVLVPEELKKPFIVRTAPVVDIHDIPNPQWEQQIIMQR